jgi:hypothetical protein
MSKGVTPRRDLGFHNEAPMLLQDQGEITQTLYTEFETSTIAAGDARLHAMDGQKRHPQTNILGILFKNFVMKHKKNNTVRRAQCGD